MISITFLSCQANDQPGSSLSLKQVHFNAKEKLIIKEEDYHHFYRITQGIRKRETLSRFMAEQKILLNKRGQFAIIVGYADTRLKYTHPTTHEQLLNNLIIDLANDPKNLFLYQPEAIDLFLAKQISFGQLKKRLIAVGENNNDVTRLEKKAHREYKEIQSRQKRYALYARDLAKTFNRKPLTIDQSFFKGKKKGLLSRPGVPYRSIDFREFQSLKRISYPLADFLLKTSTNKRVNMLPNCAQGATQLSFGTVRYTKVREIVRDRNHYFMGLQRVDQIRVGDLALIVWDYQADAQTNSGHTGVIVNVDYNSDGNPIDAALIEFFPANQSPRLIKLSQSVYEITSKKALRNIKLDYHKKKGLLFLRPKKSNNLRKRRKEKLSAPTHLIQFIKYRRKVN